MLSDSRLKSTWAVIRRYAVTVSPSMSTSPSLRCSKPAIMRSAVVLPHPEGPKDRDTCPVKVDAIGGDDLAEPLGDAAELDGRWFDVEVAVKPGQIGLCRTRF